RVPPRLVVDLRGQEVHRQELRLLLRTRMGRPLDDLADPPVQLAPAAVGEALVGGVADQGVPKSDLLVAPVDEVPEPVPCRRVEDTGDLCTERVFEQSAGERSTEDGRLPKD